MKSETTDEFFDIAAASDIGKKRNENQDHYLVADLRRQMVIRETDVPQDDCDAIYGAPEGKLMVIADGMGGHCDGEKASRTAVQESARYVLDMMHWFLKLTPDKEDDFIDQLSDAIKVVQQKFSSQTGRRQSQMGTTVTMGYLLWPKLYVVHVGDSRCYLLRDGELRQLTTDHTIAQQMVDAGAMSVADAETSRLRHVLWNCVGGSNESVVPEALRCKLQVGDVLMLCSDGLSGMLSDAEIRNQLLQVPDSKRCVESLIDAANQAGGDDNISVIVSRVIGAPASTHVAFGDDAGLDTTVFTG